VTRRRKNPAINIKEAMRGTAMTLGLFAAGAAVSAIINTQIGNLTKNMTDRRLVGLVRVLGAMGVYYVGEMVQRSPQAPKAFDVRPAALGAASVALIAGVNEIAMGKEGTGKPVIGYKGTPLFVGGMDGTLVPAGQSMYGTLVPAGQSMYGTLDPRRLPMAGTMGATTAPLHSRMQGSLVIDRGYAAPNRMQGSLPSRMQATLPRSNSKCI
jgi:hypothetical protein